MEHLLLKAATTVTDEGTFEAVISTGAEDRDGDIVEPTALVKSFQKWVEIGKLVPLADSHFDPATGHVVVVGHIDPASARVDGDRVITKGWVDQSTERGAEIWRLVKSGTLGFSYGYLVPEGGATKRAGRSKGLHIHELDLFEISAVRSGPANNETLVLSWKSADEQREEAERVEREINDASIQVDDAPPLELTPVGKALKGLDSPTVTIDVFAKRFDGLSVDDEHLYVRVITADEHAGVLDGHVKAVWTTAYVNNLPDSAFLYVEPGGSKDSEGKTVPRSKRHFPVKDASGNVDMPHLRNALARIPQSNLPQEVKDSCVRKAQGMMDRSKSVDVTDGEHSRLVDPLRDRADAVALEYASGGISRQKPPTHKAVPKPQPVLSEDELRKRCHDQMLAYLSEDIHEQVPEGEGRA